MKKCSWCGKDYPNEATICAVDGYDLTEVTPPAPPLPEEAATVQQCSTVVRATIVSGAILLFGLMRIAVSANGPALLMMVASVLVGCLLAIGVVALCSRRSVPPWPWLRVIVVTFISYVGFGLLCLALALGLRIMARAFHQ
jgi:hypothetical protein